MRDCTKCGHYNWIESVGRERLALVLILEVCGVC